MDEMIDVGAARERLKLTQEAFAAELGVTVGEVRAWEAGSLRPAKREREWIGYRIASEEWYAGVRAAGLAECERMTALLSRVDASGGTKALTRVSDAAHAHLAECDLCQAREAYAREHAPPRPPATGLLRLARAIERLPGWARPPAWGALICAAWTVFRLVFLMPNTLRSPKGLLLALGVVLLGAGGGVIGGLAFSAVRPRLRPLGAAGDYLTGIVSVAALIGAFAAVSPLLGEPLITGTASAVVLFLTCILFGAILGQMIHQPKKTVPDRETPSTAG